MKYTPAIIVAAFNRPESLKRVLASLLNAKNVSDVTLIISIDNKAPHNLNVKEVAETFNWPYGTKEVIYQEEHLGLRKHILKCGDLSEKYGSIIILEDDLLVSPFFYDYTVKALEYYDSDDNIAGISLYSQPKEDISEFPFMPLSDGSDVCFIQFPSSWGQAWSKKHWQGFKEWLGKNPTIPDIAISDYVVNWPQSSWKKFYAAYLIDCKKFFVFPRASLTTNFNDPGTHFKLNVNHDGQAPLLVIEKDFLFCDLDKSQCVYDSFLELKADRFHNWPEQLKSLDFELDLYGNKNQKTIRASYVITSNQTRNPISSYRRALKPHENNIIMGLEGQDFHLCKSEDITIVKRSIKKRIADYRYFYSRYLNGPKISIYYSLSRKKWFKFLNK
jgi:hypothetical protein